MVSARPARLVERLVVAGLSLDQIGDAAHAAGIALHELSADAGSLEDVFLSLTTNSSTTPKTTQEVHQS